MKYFNCIIGLEDAQAQEICDALDQPCLYRITLPGIKVEDGKLMVETDRRPRYVPVRKLLYHSIYEHDFDFITGLAFWQGECLPNARAMLDLRLKLPGLIRALAHTRFPFPRGFATAGMPYQAAEQSVAKWGNWHCGENKEVFTGAWNSTEAAIIEPFIAGTAVRVVMIGEQAWQIQLEGDNWLKSIHHADAAFMDVDPELLEDTRNLKAAFNMQVIANDYMIAADGKRYLLEVNHIPNVSRFPEIWAAYRDYAIDWFRVSE